MAIGDTCGEKSNLRQKVRCVRKGAPVRNLAKSLQQQGFAQFPQNYPQGCGAVFVQKSCKKQQKCGRRSVITFGHKRIRLFLAENKMCFRGGQNMGKENDPATKFALHLQGKFAIIASLHRRG